MTSWLTLRLSEPVLSTGRADSPKALISIPKKAIRLAVRRNRIRRLLREVLRREPRFGPERVYHFRVARQPDSPDYDSVRREALDQLDRAGGKDSDTVKGK